MIVLLVYLHFIIQFAYSSSFTSRVPHPIFQLTFTEGQLVNHAPQSPAEDLTSSVFGTFNPTEGASWIQDTTGIHIDGLAAGDRLVSSQDASKLTPAIQSSSDLTIELWLRLKNLTQSGIIMALGNLSTNGLDRAGCNDISFSIEQDQGSILAVFSTYTTIYRCPIVQSALLDNAELNLVHLVIVRSGNSLSMYMNGTQLAFSPAQGGYTKWNPTHLLHFGTKLGHAWSGNIYYVAMYNKSLSEPDIVTNYNALLPNNRPITRNSSVIIDGDSSVNFTLGAYDADGDSLLLTFLSVPQLGFLTNGTVVITPSTTLADVSSLITFSSKMFLHGIDSFEYQACTITFQTTTLFHYCIIIS
jgi:hypothetical protein